MGRGGVNLITPGAVLRAVASAGRAGDRFARKDVTHVGISIWINLFAGQMPLFCASVPAPI
jgi:hypothetical protein